MPKSLPVRFTTRQDVCRIGATIVVRFGRGGKQFAVIEDYAFRAGTIIHHFKVRKYRQNSRRWTDTVTIAPGEILRMATTAEIAALPYSTLGS
ncbi:MAG TPA: hypothetical protein VKA60_27625 [Blastocatellia bacterium]|nr:hypothetical protein [Blastocatellia bacterium]